MAGKAMIREYSVIVDVRLLTISDMAISSSTSRQKPKAPPNESMLAILDTTNILMTLSLQQMQICDF